MTSAILDQIRAASPLIHCITNYVTVNDVANVLLAIGARPIMADDPEEVEEITALCAGLCLNIGTLNARTIPSMLAAGKRARALGHPVVLDPVGAGASRLRTATALRILDEVRPTLIRGNISEVRTLAVGAGTTQGVDANAADAVTEDNLAAAAELLRAFAARTEAIVAVTGAIDRGTAIPSEMGGQKWDRSRGRAASSLRSSPPPLPLHLPIRLRQSPRPSHLWALRARSRGHRWGSVTATRPIARASLMPFIA